MRRTFVWSSVKTKGKNTKYKNEECVIDGIKFKSLFEGQRYSELKLMQKAHLIEDLELQKKFVLIPAQYETYERYSKTGKKLSEGKRLLEREVAYLADFCYRDTKTGLYVVEDTKGVRTKEYLIKRKLMLYVHHIKISELHQ